MKNRTLQKPRWTDHGDFSVHYAHNDNVACINPHVLKTNRRDVEPGFKFNSYQYWLFRKCLFGLDVFDEYDLKNMNRFEVMTVKQNHKRSLQALNLFRQRALVEITNRFLLSFCKEDSKVGFFFKMAKCTDTDPDFICRETFDQLGITRKMMADELIDKGLLPKNFYELTELDDPRAKLLIQGMKESLE